MTIRAITFDLWDTLVADDSDEPRRAAAGLLPKPAARAQLFVEHVTGRFPDLPEDKARAAWQTSLDWFRHEWLVLHRTPGVEERVHVGLRDLGLPPGTVLPDLVDAIARMEVDIPPDPAPGVRACLDQLHGRYALGIVSDAIVTPGSGLREILDGWGLLRFFDVFVFSDEAGAAKPAPKVFEIACAGLHCAPYELVHIGDREGNDIAGPVAFGARSILYTGLIDRGSEGTQADAVCDHHDALPGIIDQLSQDSTAPDSDAPGPS
jgi:FMN phosphatase YigB (HAD superfamily)